MDPQLIGEGQAIHVKVSTGMDVNAIDFHEGRFDILKNSKHGKDRRDGNVFLHELYWHHICEAISFHRVYIIQTISHNNSMLLFYC